MRIYACDFIRKLVCGRPFPRIQVKQYRLPLFCVRRGPFCQGLGGFIFFAFSVGAVCWNSLIVSLVSGAQLIFLNFSQDRIHDFLFLFIIFFQYQVKFFIFGISGGL